MDYDCCSFIKHLTRKPILSHSNKSVFCIFHDKQGREAIDDIIEELKSEASEFSEDFESFSRRSIRRLGRLLPDAGRVLPDDRSAVSKSKYELRVLVMKIYS